MGSPMISDDAVADWHALSALYDEAEALEDGELQGWLQGVEETSRHLVPQLLRMLEARAEIEQRGFLVGPPLLKAAPPAAPDVAWQGTVVGAYRLVRRIGTGGSAEVWLGERADGSFTRKVAVKLPFDHLAPGQRESYAERFRRERSILASLDHPNIARLVDAGITPDGQPWIALDYVEGEAITAWCDRKRASLRERVRVFREVLLAVEYAHANLVIHRDLKPANILVTESGSVRLLDFGIAKLLATGEHAALETELTRDAGRPMTLAYASPEQLLGQPLTTASDVYSLGVVLYELACGERPYELDVRSAARVEEAILHSDPKPPSRRNVSEDLARARAETPRGLQRQLAGDFDAVVFNALAKEPERRYRSAEALRLELDRWLDGEPVQARPPTFAYVASKFVGRHRAGVAAAAVVSVALLALTASSVYLGLQAQRESARAIASRDILLDMFRNADPDQGKGGEVTARQVLDRGRETIEAKFSGQPELQAELLAEIGDTQRALGEGKQAETTLEHAALLYERLGREREALSTRNMQAQEILRLGDRERAKSFIEQIEARARRLPSERKLLAEILTVKGQVQRNLGQSTAAEITLREALRLSEEVHGPNNNQVLGLMANLASAQSDLFKFDAASSTVEEALRRAPLTPEVTPTYWSNLDFQQAKLEVAAGRYARARELVAAALPRCASSLGANHEWCLLLALRQADTLLVLGGYQEARALIASLVPWIDLDGHPQRQAESLVTAYRIVAANGEVDAYAGWREKLLLLGRSGAEVRLSKGVKLKALLAVAEADIRMDRSGQSLAILDDTAKMVMNKSDVDGDVLVLGRHQLLRGLALRQHGDLTGAMQAYEQSRSLYKSKLGGGHPLVALVELNRAASLSSQGDGSEAARVAAAALGVLTQPLRADAPVIIAARQWLETLGVPKGDEASMHGAVPKARVPMFFT
ncbi:MAG: protein kinase [Pseudomonadota bacterium]|nr:protein kinase [Pseudomonadota bacterium]